MRGFSQEQSQGEQEGEETSVCVSVLILRVVPSGTDGCGRKGGSVMRILSGSSSLRRTRRQTPGTAAPSSSTQFPDLIVSSSHFFLMSASVGGF